MTKKFNIVLIPINENKKAIALSQSLKNVADIYLLGKESLPHVTLYQFDADENDIPNIWEKTCADVTPESIELKFEKFSCITFDNSTYWASLLPDNTDTLLKMHKAVASIINKPAKQNYDPHMTLISSKDKSYQNAVTELSKDYSPIKDTFILAIGESDDIGQLTKIVFTRPLEEKCLPRLSK